MKTNEQNLSTLNKSKRIDGLDLQAYLDKELSNQRRQEIKEAIASDTILQKRYLKLSEQKKLIRQYWQSLKN